MLVTISLLLISVSTSLQAPLLAEEKDNNILNKDLGSTNFDLPPIQVEKMVWNGSGWVDSLVINEGDVVEFGVSIYNPFDEYEIHWSGIIYDELPCNLRYINGSTTVPLETDHPELDPEQYYLENNTVIWHVDKESPILPHQYLNFSYNAKGVCCGSGYLNNVLTVSPNELIHYCNTSDVIVNDGSYDVSDSASIKVICDNPSIAIHKMVKDGGVWKKSTTVYVGDDVEFKILVENDGTYNLTSLEIIDSLPTNLVYNYDANITAYSETDHKVTWHIGSLDIGESIEITFSAHAIEIGETDNIVSVDTCEGVTDSDTAEVIVAGMLVTKKVKDGTHWVDEVDAAVGEKVRFKITVYYYGNGTYTLYNIRIRDELPECLDYDDNANPAPTAISSDQKTIWWNLTTHVNAGGSISVEFDALVTETSGCGPCINIGNVTANECSGHIFTQEDTATVNAACPLQADAGGPYTGDIDQTIVIQGSATGGTPPYMLKWDLDDDGYFDDATGTPVYESWDEDGTYYIHLKVIDDDGKTDVDSTSVTIAPAENNEPDDPIQPQGPNQGTVGTSYTYSTEAVDDDDDLIKYGWDWNGDNVVDEWTGYYPSDSTVSTTHSWTSTGTYAIKVKAEDEHGEESGYSPTLTVIITEENAPYKPYINGPTSGKIDISYIYTASTTDPEGDQLYYFFDWGDGTNSGWQGPYNSGQQASVSKEWSNQGTYVVKVKAKDADGKESVWSDPLSVTMPKQFNLIAQIIQWIITHFPFLSSFF